MPTRQEAALPGYSYCVEREDRWWMVHIPELGGLTQARHPGEAGLMAREWIAVSQGISIADVEVRRVDGGWLAER